MSAKKATTAGRADRLLLTSAGACVYKSAPCRGESGKVGRIRHSADAKDAEALLAGRAAGQKRPLQVRRTRRREVDRPACTLGPLAGRTTIKACAVDCVPREMHKSEEKNRTKAGCCRLDRQK